MRRQWLTVSGIFTSKMRESSNCNIIIQRSICLSEMLKSDAHKQQTTRVQTQSSTDIITTEKTERPSQPYSQLDKKVWQRWHGNDTLPWTKQTRKSWFERTAQSVLIFRLNWVQMWSQCSKTWRRSENNTNVGIWRKTRAHLLLSCSCKMFVTQVNYYSWKKLRLG